MLRANLGCPTTLFGRGPSRLDGPRRQSRETTWPGLSLHEIYGGFRSTWDYGPLGVLLKRNVKDAWWRSMVQLRDDVVGLDASILMGPEGLGGQRPPGDVHGPAGGLPELQGAVPGGPAARVRRLPQLRGEGLVHRGPQLQPDVQDVRGPGRGRRVRSRTCGRRRRRASSSTSRTCRPPRARSRRSASRRSASRSATRSRRATSSSARVSSSRWRWSSSSRPKTPSSGTSTGASSGSTGTRTSASPRRCCGCARTIPTSSRTTASAPSDVEFDYPWGWGELEGIANRTDYDLNQHSEFSGEDLSYFDQENDRHYIPYVIEPAAGADRATLAFLLAAYHEDEAPTADGKVEKRTVLRLDPRLAPIKVAVLPLSKNEKLVPDARAGRRRPAAALHRSTSTWPARSAPLPAPGRGRDAVLRHRRLRHARRQRRHGARPRLDEPGSSLTRPTRRPPPGATSAMSTVSTDD